MYLLTLYFPFFFIFQHLCTFAPFVLLWRNSQLMGNICETSRDPRGPERAADAGQRKGGAAAVFPPLLLPLLCRELAPALAHAAAVLILRGFPAPPFSQWSPAEGRGQAWRDLAGWLFGVSFFATLLLGVSFAAHFFGYLGLFFLQPVFFGY